MEVMDSHGAVRSRYPHYDWCCRTIRGYKTVEGNVRFRRRVLKLALEDAKYARELWIMCSRDMLFFVNTFCFVHEPRADGGRTILPFITWDCQDVALDEIQAAIDGGFDQLSEKSRDMGASWMYVVALTYKWLFREFLTFRLVSRNQDLVDKTDNTDSLFWKVDFLIEHLPGFLRPPITRGKERTELHLSNPLTRSTIEGCATTGDVTRGGRCTAMLLDEFAAVPEGHAVLSSTRDVTKVRLFNSTHKGTATAFYQLSLGAIRKLRLHWSLHPEKRRGLYTTSGGRLVLLDTEFRGKVRLQDPETRTEREYQFPDDYPFRLDGKLRSPWYDFECDRAVHEQEIAQELDIDPFAADSPFFDPEKMEDLRSKYATEPVLTGFLEYEEETCRPTGFREDPHGNLHLWFYPDDDGMVPSHIKAAVAFDISAGTGASNSAAAAGNIETGEQLAEFADPWIKPETYARWAVALARWFNEAYMIWDGGGPGRTFGDTVVNLGYYKVYYKRHEQSLSKRATDIPGCFLVPAEKNAVLGEYRRALVEGVYVQRSGPTYDEAHAYIYTTTGKVEHSAALNPVDPSGAREAHGDRLIANALLVRAMNLEKHERQRTTVIPPFSYAGRQAALKAKDRDEWP